jgi:hypothetical protein
MERPIEQRERGSLSCAGQRRALRDLVSPLDVCRRECTQRTGHLREREVAEVPILQVRDPGDECVSQTARSYILEVRATVSRLLSEESTLSLSVLKMEVSMSTVQRLLVAPLILLMMGASPAFADQQHVLDPSRLAATIEQRVAAQDADRAVVHEALERPEVRELAAKMGLDVARATAAVDTMAATDLAQAANAARQVHGQLVGGASNISISTTTLIIILLLIIILIVAIK